MSGLAIVLGTFGVHKFFQGKTKWGMAYLFLFWTMIPTLVSIVEGIRYLFMPVDDFYNQYYR
jgi:TM2 domain-containing membrane protein YozV